ncbi:MAG: hypothetical protein ACAH59_08235 [Pseudobdellovibrionaceae bacterium]
MKSLGLVFLSILCLATACERQKNEDPKESFKGGVQTSPTGNEESKPLVLSERAYYSYVDPVTKLNTHMVYDGSNSEDAILCRSFLDELEAGKTDLIESIPASETSRHEVLRGCARENKMGNGLMLVARASLSVSRKLELFKLLVEKYKFPTGLASHVNSYDEGFKAPVDSYSVLNVVAENDELLPLTEYLISQKALNTYIAYPFGYNNGPEGDWCRPPLVLATFVNPFLRYSSPSFSPRETLQIKTFKILMENRYTYASAPMNIWDCTGEHRYETVLSYLERIKSNPSTKMENLDEAIRICKSALAH